jgi:small subunit ribosomal protein S2
METSGEMAKLPRKEESAIKREMTRMQKNFSGIADMGGLPSAMFVVDVNHHKIAVAEASRSGIPCVGLVDTNSDPATVSHPIPGNDDAVKSVRIIVEAVTAAVQSGLALRESRRAQRGAADLRGVTAGVETAAPVAAPVEGEAAPAEVPAEGAAPVEGEGEAAAKKKTVRAKRPAVKAE